MVPVVPINERPQGDIVCLFDVDDTLTPARRGVSPEIIEVLKQVRAKAAIGFVGGSDLRKITEQLALNGQDISDDFDFCFAENGLIAIKLGKQLEAASFINFIGEEKYKKMVRFILHYIADLDIPIKRGTFIEFRNGMINVQERNEFEKYDMEAKVRATFIEALKKEFADYGLTYSIGGQISFDVFPNGWNKTYALRHIEADNFREIHFFGGKTYKGGNDYEIYTDPRTIGHSVESPADTIRELKKLFNL
ncbi:BZ3500_MvSof-1268-A1-R1_Chr2-3g05255 [Microbotryum saponariae]|uniref:Phosphomannomutase n=1 Tax=Microbotryum saponariae TaxID=289078 RepID=A0A2X0L3C1_9BASI|nr:BZ3500_MvSof-1268-A1-R1_Chr2-3g05255 [Microbotryum saponariae]SDA01081.1 BZ3501_MvSof-1269-A2-R1_Chr2-2g04928 [Microbotryum saponariae]